MALQGDTTRPHGVKAEFDPKFSATPRAGVVLIERLLRQLGLRRLLAEHLPARAEQAQYTSVQAAQALVAGLLAGGRGIRAAEILREDPLAAEIFGLARAVPEEATMYRVLCQWGGLPQRRQEQTYAPAGARLARLDLLGREKPAPVLRRVVPAAPEAIDPERREGLRRLERAVARRCWQGLGHARSQLAGWRLLFGDATDLEVEGRCFDAARMGRDGQRLLRWFTLMLGPLMVGQELLAGDRDEGVTLPDLLRGAGATVDVLAGKSERVLALMDSAYLEKDVLDALGERRWKFIIGANQWREILTRRAQEQPAAIWRDSGADAARGWAISRVGVFIHQADNWRGPVTIVARRWREEGELPGAPWHDSFVATNLEPGDVAGKPFEGHAYGAAIWMLYSVKQGEETHYKTALSDLGLHHPPSGRLGIDQVFYALGTVAFNLAMVLRHRVLDGQDAGMRLWRVRELYLTLAGYLVRGGRRLIVRLAGASVQAQRQVLWERAWVRAGTA